MTLNVQGLGSYQKQKHIYQYIREKQIDIALLQETHVDEKLEKNCTVEWGSKWYSSYGASNVRGVSILFSHKLSKMGKIEMIKHDTQGRLIICQITINDKDF